MKGRVASREQKRQPLAAERGLGVTDDHSRPLNSSTRPLAGSSVSPTVAGPTSWWLGADVVLLSGDSARRAYAALALAIRELAPRRNGVPLPEDVVADLRVLRQAADFARESTVGFAGGSGQVSQEPAASTWGREDLVDAFEVARMLGVSVQYARRLCSRGRFESTCRVGREWRVSAAEVEVFAETSSERSA